MFEVISWSQISLSLKILVVNGPNLNLLGKREPGVYGNTSLDNLLEELCAAFPEMHLEMYQSNVEGELINKLQEADGSFDGIVLNAAGYTHTSVSLRDTISAISRPVVEVHMSNISAREEFRHNSLIAPVCIGSIAGFGKNSYLLGVSALKTFLEQAD
jgi:3-dehydroquinate dehydratase-2